MIGQSSIGDNDRLLTLFTKDFGIIRAFAVGAKSVKSKRGGATSLLSYSNFIIDKKRDTYKIIEAAANKIFFGAGSDVVVLSVAQYFCELCTYLGPQDDTADEFLRVILNSLYFMIDKRKNPVLIKAITELRICAISGYAPSINECAVCGSNDTENMYFMPDNGIILCRNCKKGKEIFLNKTILDAMRHIVYSDIKNLYFFDIPEKDILALEKITEKYIVIQTEHRFSTLDFYDSVK